MTDPRKVDLTMITDRSGSMVLIATDMIGGFDSFVKAQQQAAAAEHGPTTTLSLLLFDDRYEWAYQGKPIAEVGPLPLVPRGRTALLDALGRAITETGQRLAALPEEQRPGKVLIGVITDGLENASKEFTAEQIRALIKQQEEVYGWTFTYLGANQDAVAVAGDLGFTRGHTMTYDLAHTGVAMDAYSLRSAAFASADPGTGFGFTEEDRAAADPGHGDA